MVELKLNGCTLTILPASHVMNGKLRLKTKRRKIEWQCPECGTKNRIKVRNLPYEFAGGDDWSRVLRSAAYAEEMSKLCKKKSDLISFLIEEAKIKRKYLAEGFQPKYSASTRIKEQCVKCKAEIIFNVELSSNKQFFTEQTENSIVKTQPEDADKTVNRLIQGGHIYHLMKDFSLKIDLESVKRIKVDKKWLETVKEFLEWINYLKNDLENLILLDNVKEEIKKLMVNFQTQDASMYISDILLFIERTKASMIKSLKRKLFLSLAGLKEQIESLISK